jgi:hypothetical protein
MTGMTLLCHFPSRSVRKLNPVCSREYSKVRGVVQFNIRPPRGSAISPQILGRRNRRESRSEACLANQMMIGWNPPKLKPPIRVVQDGAHRKRLDGSPDPIPPGAFLIVREIVEPSSSGNAEKAL